MGVVTEALARARDPDALTAWYRDRLGVDPVPQSAGDEPWRQDEGVTAFAPFTWDSEMIGPPEHTWMLNFRVADLDAMLAQLRAKGADVDEEAQDMEGVGRFGWVTDSEGNRIELWQPA